MMTSERFEDSTDKIRKHRKNLLSLLSLKRSILEYEKSPSDKNLLNRAPNSESKGKTVEVKGGNEQPKAKLKQSKTIHTDISACSSDRRLEKKHQQTANQLIAKTTKAERCSTKLTIKHQEPQIDLRKEISNKINALKSMQAISSSLVHNSKQLLAKENTQSKVSQFLDKYKSNYRIENRKLTAADRQHLEIERMANEANKLKDTNDTGPEEIEASTPPKAGGAREKGKSAADIRPTIKARLQMRRQLPCKTILKQRYQILQKIGRGLSGEVYKARDILSDRFVAIKVIVEVGDKREEEYEFYKTMQHRNIVTYYNNFKANGNRFLVLQYFPYTLSRLCKTRPLDIQQIKRVFRGIANGLMFLHGLSIAHRDIKLDNIVISEDLAEVKFIDFGLCIDLSKCQGQLTREFCGTIHYMPPEILEKRAYNPKKADIWSLGVLLYRLLFNRYPFNAKNEFHMLEKIRKTKLVLGDCGTELSLLLEGMLSKNPNDRYTILDVLDSKWMS